MDMCALQLGSSCAQAPRFIFSHSNRFGLLTAPRSKLPQRECACGVDLGFPTLMPSNRVPVIIPFVVTATSVNTGSVSVRIVSAVRLCCLLFFLTCLKNLWHSWNRWIFPLKPSISLTLFALAFASTLGPSVALIAFRAFA